MAERDDVPAELRARIDALVSHADARGLTVAAADRLSVVLDLIDAGRGVREAGSGLNAASSELLVADALLTDAAASAALDGDFDALLRALRLDELAARAGELDERARGRAEHAPGPDDSADRPA